VNEVHGDSDTHGRTTTLTYAQLADSIGTELGPSLGIHISQERIDAFAETTEDRQWIHVDPDRAATGRFGAPIAHGYLSLSLASAFLEQLLKVTDVDVIVNYGLNRVRFPSPVIVGSDLTAAGEIIDVESGDGWTQVTIRLAMNAGGAKPACVADILARFVPSGVS
jgi:acyl dehydratase